MSFRFDSKLNDLLDPQYAALDSRLDSRIQRKWLGINVNMTCSVMIDVACKSNTEANFRSRAALLFRIAVRSIYPWVM